MSEETSANIIIKHEHEEQVVDIISVNGEEMYKRGKEPDPNFVRVQMERLQLLNEPYKIDPLNSLGNDLVF